MILDPPDNTIYAQFVIGKTTFQSENPNLEGCANGVSLNQAKDNYKKFGAVEERLIKYVRSPKEDEFGDSD